MKFIHYSSEKMELERRVYDQNKSKGAAKPYGLWFSVESEDFEENNYNWKQWCEVENFRLDHLKFVYELKFKEDAKILFIKTKEELIDFSNNYLVDKQDWFHHKDWLKVKEEYDAIIIAPYQWDCRLALETSWYYSWDCSSGCVWNIDSIKSFEFIEEKALPEALRI